MKAALKIFFGGSQKVATVVLGNEKLHRNFR